MTYMQKYYAEHLDYFRWYRKKHRDRYNARKRERYASDSEYRRRDIERHRKKSEVSDGNDR